jgi:eukaryotic-like serine/threonine-protein kinase
MVPEDGYSMPRLAPGGRRAAVWVRGSRRTWLLDVDRGGRTPLTSTAERAVYPVWSPDGRSIALQASSGIGQTNLYRRAADGTGALERLTTSRNVQYSLDWSPDGTTLAFLQIAPGTPAQIWTLDVRDPKHATRQWLQTMAVERFPTFSPDGRWLAYSSDESGRQEVYVQPFPGPGPRVRISSDGGNAPAWRGDGAELFYLSVGSDSPPSYSDMMVVPLTVTAAGLSPGPPRKLFDARGFET